jgi:ADP-heptose:LPS heptosyltransferase
LPGLLGRHDWLISCFAGGQQQAERRLAEMCGARRADFLPTRPPADFDGHLLDLWWGMLGEAGSPVPPRWSVPAAWRRRAERLLAGKGVASGDDRPYAVLHPGAGAPRKCWPLDRFIELAGRLRGRGAGVVFTLGPAELERWPIADLDRLRGQFVTLEDQPLTVLAGALSSAACYVGNDSGVTHLAAAAGAATVALFGPTDPRHFRPVGENVAVIARPTLAEIRVDDVLEAIGKRPAY